MKFLSLLALFFAFILVVAAFEQDESSDLVDATNDLTAVEGIIDDEHSINKRDVARRRRHRHHRRQRRRRQQRRLRRTRKERRQLRHNRG